MIDTKTGVIYSIQNGVNLIPDALQPQLQQVACAAFATMRDVPTTQAATTPPNEVTSISPTRLRLSSTLFERLRPLLEVLQTALFLIVHLAYVVLVPPSFFSLVSRVMHPGEFTRYLGDSGLMFFVAHVLTFVVPPVIFLVVLRGKYLASPRNLGEIFWLCEVPIFLFASAVTYVPQPFSLPGAWLLFGGTALFLIARVVLAMCGNNSQRGRTLFSLFYCFGLFSFLYAMMIFSLFLLSSLFIILPLWAIIHASLDLFYALIMYASSVIFLMVLRAPYKFLFQTLKSAAKLLEVSRKTNGNLMTFTALIVIFVLWCLLLFWSAWQPNLSPLSDEFRRLNQAQTFEEQRMIIKSIRERYDDQDILKEIEALGKRISSYWFVNEEKDDAGASHYRSKRSGVVHLGPESFYDLGTVVGRVMKIVALPFTYRGPHEDAGVLYQNARKWFAVGHEVNDSRVSPPVHLLSRSYSAQLDESRTFATVYVTDEYINYETLEQQVVYEFSLPSDAAVVDLKFGINLDSPASVTWPGTAEESHEDNPVRFQNNLTTLEMTGPRQYRLRVYPITGRDDATDEPGRQKVQFAYVVRVEDGIALLRFSRSLNLGNAKAADRLTTYNIDGFPATVTQDRLMQTTNGFFLTKLCADVFASMTTGIPDRYRMSMRAHEKCGSRKEEPIDLQGKKIAILVDVSANRKKNPAYARQMLAPFRELDVKNKIDVFEYSEALSNPQTLSDYLAAAETTFFGESHTARALKVAPGKAYHAVVVITDKNTNLKEPTEIAQPGYYVYFVFDDGVIPSFPAAFARSYFYRDSGFIADDLFEVFSHMQLMNDPDSLVSDGPQAWEYVSKDHVFSIGVEDHTIKNPTEEVLVLDSNALGDSLSKIAVKHYLVNGLYSFYGLQENQRNTTPWLISATFNVVSPFGSMVVPSQHQYSWD
jgi:hypothetical protein